VELQERLAAAQLIANQPQLIGAALAGPLQGAKIRVFHSQNYYTAWWKDSGLFLRVPFANCQDPLWCESGPEIIDWAITEKCNKSCRICYSNATPEGRETTEAELEAFCKALKTVPVHSVALGGGNPNEHPLFPTIVRRLHETGAIPTYTTNGEGVTDEVLEATKQHCGAVAVSWPWDGDTNDLVLVLSTLRKFIRAGIQTNIHFVLGKDSISEAIRITRYSPKYWNLDGLNAIVFLLYKPVGRATEDGLLDASNPKLLELFSLLGLVQGKQKPTGWPVGFDSCSVPILLSLTDTNRELVETCESARFSMFLTTDLRAAPCSFMQHQGELPSILSSSILDVWQHNELFTTHRDLLLHHHPVKCMGCSDLKHCLGGCTYLPQIVDCQRSDV